MHGGQIRNRRLYCQRSRPVPKAVFRAGRGGQWVHYFVALVRESEEAMYNETTLKEEFTSSVRLAVIRELKEKFKNELMREISNPISQKIEDIARESMSDLIENASEKKYRFRLDYMDEELTVDEFIRGRMKKVVDSNIETMVESKAKSFVNELRKRYDMAFAAFVVDNMRKQNMLKEDKIAELLKDNPNEK